MKSGVSPVISSGRVSPFIYGISSHIVETGMFNTLAMRRAVSNLIFVSFCIIEYSVVGAVPHCLNTTMYVGVDEVCRDWGCSKSKAYTL